MNLLRLRLLAPALGAALALVPLTADASPPDVYVFHSAFTVVDATFTSTDASAGVTTVAEISAINSRAQRPEQPPQYALVVTATIEQFSTSPGNEVLFNAYTEGILAGQTMTTRPTLTHTSVVGSLLMRDQVSNRQFRLDVNVAWSCPQPAAPDPSKFHQHESLFTINLTNLNRINFGCVASGSLRKADLTEFVAAPTTNTFVGSGRSGEVDIFRH